jgi:hypothetical protein
MKSRIAAGVSVADEGQMRRQIVDRQPIVAGLHAREFQPVQAVGLHHALHRPAQIDDKAQAQAAKGFQPSVGRVCEGRRAIERAAAHLAAMAALVAAKVAEIAHAFDDRIALAHARPQRPFAGSGGVLPAIALWRNRASATVTARSSRRPW